MNSPKDGVSELNNVLQHAESLASLDGRVPENGDNVNDYLSNDTTDAGKGLLAAVATSNNAIEASTSRKSSLGSNAPPRRGVCTPKMKASFVLCCGFLCFGASMAIIGPTVLELGCLIGSDVGAMSWVFFAQTCSALIGAICSGIITDRFAINYNLYLACVMSVHAVALSILPFMRTLGSLITLTAMHGLFGGFQDTATNLRMIIMHGQEVPPYLQTLFFFYGVGAFISPIVAGNFLNDECNQGDTSSLQEFAFSRRRRHNGIGRGHWIQSAAHPAINLAANQSNSRPVPPHEIRRISSTVVHYSYWVIGILHLIVVMSLIYLYFAEKRRRRASLVAASLPTIPSTTQGDETQSVTSSFGDDLEDNESIRSEIDEPIRMQVIIITVWIGIMVFISDGLQGSFGSYIYTYAVKSGVGITADDAAYLNSLFWGALALGRLLAIFVSIYVSPSVMLFVDIAGCLTSIIAMLVMRHAVISLWIGTASFGLCLSNIFPTSVSLAESYFRLTGTITCIFVVCSGLGEMTIPLVIGKLFDVIGPIGFLGISMILCCLAVFIYIAVIVTGRALNKKLKLLDEVNRTIDIDTVGEETGLLSQELSPTPDRQNLIDHDRALSQLMSGDGIKAYASPKLRERKGSP